MFDPNTSLFGYQSDSPAARAAYDMMVMKDMGVLDEGEDEDENKGGGVADLGFRSTPTRGWRWY